MATATKHTIKLAREYRNIIAQERELRARKKALKAKLDERVNVNDEVPLAADGVVGYWQWVDEAEVPAYTRDSYWTFRFRKMREAGAIA